jgi:hypothetical protein
MPKIYTTEEVKELEDGLAVTAFKGKVKKIFKRSKGTNEHGDWSLQGIVLVDPAGDEIEGKLKDREELPAKFLNQQVCIVAHKGDKGWVGMKAKDNTFNDKTARVLWITGAAEIVKGGELPAEDASSGESSDTDLDATSSSQQDEPTTRTAPKSTADPVREAKVAALKRANLMAVSLRATDSMLQIYNDSGKVNVTPELHQACTMSIFISMDRAGLSNDLPVTPVYPPKPDGDLEPENPKKKK